MADSTDGLVWKRATCAIDGLGYGGAGLDAVHAEDMSLVQIGKSEYRMYYAACHKDGNWRIASAVAEGIGGAAADAFSAGGQADHIPEDNR